MSELIESVIIKAAAMGAPARHLAAADVLRLVDAAERKAAAAIDLGLYVDDFGGEEGCKGRLQALTAIREAIMGALETDKPWTMDDWDWIRAAIRG